jgi:hypothetical protein
MILDIVLFLSSVASGLGFGYCVQCFWGTDLITVLRNAPSTL